MHGLACMVMLIVSLKTLFWTIGAVLTLVDMLIKNKVPVDARVTWIWFGVCWTFWLGVGVAVLGRIFA